MASGGTCEMKKWGQKVGGHSLGRGEREGSLCPLGPRSEGLEECKG